MARHFKKNVIELASRRILVNMQVSKFVWDLDEEEESFLKDYIDMSIKTESLRKYLCSLSDSELLEIENVVVTLGYRKSSSVLEKISKLRKKDIEK